MKSSNTTAVRRAFARVILLSTFVVLGLTLPAGLAYAETGTLLQDESMPVCDGGLTQEELDRHYPRMLAPERELPKIDERQGRSQPKGDEGVRVQSANGAELGNGIAPYFDDYESAVAYVCDCVRTHETSVVLRMSEGLAKDSWNGNWFFIDAYWELTNHTGRPFEGDNWCLGYKQNYEIVDVKTEEDGSVTVSATIAYATTQFARMKETVEQIANDLALHDNNLSDYDKVKAIHDYIVGNVEYDYDLCYGTSDHTDGFYCYGALIDHLAVCNGYSEAFYCLCLEAGVDCRVIVSDQLNHAWNIVRLDGSYYYVDCTWDDTGGDAPIDYDFFLCGSLDFQMHATDDETLGFGSQYAALSEYADTYPLHELGWRLNHWSSLELPEAPDYALITSDGKIVSTTAEKGRAKVIVFVKEGRDHLRSERGKDPYSGVDVLYCGIGITTIKQESDALNKIGSDSYPSDVPGEYCFCGNSRKAYFGFNEYSGIVSGGERAVVISPNNKIIIILTESDFPNLDEILKALKFVKPGVPEPVESATDYGNWEARGVCGYQTVWHYYGNGTLRISGTGAPNYGDFYCSVSMYGWIERYSDLGKGATATNVNKALYVWGKDVKSVVVDAGITDLYHDQFSTMSGLESVIFKGHAPHYVGGYCWLWNDRYDYWRGKTSLFAYYPKNDATWTKAAKEALTGGYNIVWVPYNAKRAEFVTPTVKLSKSSYVFDGKEHKPAVKVMVGNTVLPSKSYLVSYTRGQSDTDDFKKAGTITARVTLRNDYVGIAKKKFTITKAANPITVKTVTRTANATTLAKKAVTVARPLSVTNAQGKVTYSKVSGSSALTINKKTGQVTVKKGAKKGTYTIKVKATAAGNANYKARSRYVTCKVVVK